MTRSPADIIRLDLSDPAALINGKKNEMDELLQISLRRRAFKNFTADSLDESLWTFVLQQSI